MKTNRLFYTMLLCGGMGWIAGSCTSEEPSYEEVAVVDDAQYYVTGRVETNGVGAAGVTVSTPGLPAVQTDENGVYLIESKEAGRTMILSFAAPGYVTAQGSVSLPSDMAPNASHVLNVTLAKQGAEVWIERNRDMAITPTEDVTLQIPANAMTADRNLSVSVAPSTAGDNEFAMTQIVCSPQGVSFDTPATLIINNKASKDIVFDEPELYVKNPLSLEWEKSATASFDPEQNAYKASVPRSGCYILRPKYQVDKGPVVVTDEVNAEKEVDNCGNLNAKRNVFFLIKQKVGWYYTLDPDQAIQTAIPNISFFNKLGLNIHVRAMVLSYTGSCEGTFTLPRRGCVCVSGNSHLLYINKAKIREDTLTIPVYYCLKKVNIIVKLKQYVGEDIQYIQIPCDVHSGGSGN